MISGLCDMKNSIGETRGNYLVFSVSVEYQKRGEGCERDGAKPAGVGVGDEGSNQRSKVGDAEPDVDDVGGRHLVHAIHPEQVHHEVR